jgi:site-specific recombinase XerD
MRSSFSLVPAVADTSQVGPLHNHIGGFAEALAKQAYANYTIDQKVRLLAELDQWLLRRRIQIEDLAEEHIDQFLRSRRNRGHGRGGDPSTLRSLLRTLREVKITSPPVEKRDASEFDDIQKRFTQYLIDERGLNPATVAWYVFETRTFLSARFGKGAISLDQLSSRDIAKYVLHHARSRRPRGVQRSVTALRGFLRFLQQRGDIATNLAGSVPRVANWSGGGLPKYLPASEVELLLESCNEQTDEGRRNRAILLLLARLGLRAGEVVHLTLDDIDWDVGELRIRGKGGRQDRLPIPADVGKALVTYIRYARPSCLSRRVFIRLNAPHQGLAGASNIAYVVRRALRRAGLRPSFSGSHLLRHSLATRMLRGGASLTEIGKILRHQLPSTTAIYAKVDLAALRALVRPWPGGEA